MRLVPSPSGSNLPTFFRWCLGGMPAIASGSGSASASAAARDADPLARFLRHAEEMKRDCDRIPADQEEILAHAQFLGSDDEEDEEAVEEEVFSTPPLTQQDLQGQGQSQRGQAGVGEDDIVMCSVPFTQTQPSSPPDGSSTPSDGGRQSKRSRKKQETRKPRICVRKVRVSGPPKLATPPPSPESLAPPPPPAPPAPALAPTPPTPAPVPTPAPMSAPATPASAPPPNPSPELDPLARIIFMIPTRPLPTTGHKNLVELGRHLGLF